MSSINRIDQAVLLLRARLESLGRRNGGVNPSLSATSAAIDPLAGVRALTRQGQVPVEELRKAMVRLLLAEAFGEKLSGSLEFDSLADQVVHILEGSDAGRDLLMRALAELG